MSGDYRVAAAGGNGRVRGGPMAFEPARKGPMLDQYELAQALDWRRRFRASDQAIAKMLNRCLEDVQRSMPVTRLSEVKPRPVEPPPPQPPRGFAAEQIEKRRAELDAAHAVAPTWRGRALGQLRESDWKAWEALARERLGLSLSAPARALRMLVQAQERPVTGEALRRGLQQVSKHGVEPTPQTLAVQMSRAKAGLSAVGLGALMTGGKAAAAWSLGSEEAAGAVFRVVIGEGA